MKDGLDNKLNKKLESQVMQTINIKTNKLIHHKSIQYKPKPLLPSLLYAAN